MRVLVQWEQGQGPIEYLLIFSGIAVIVLIAIRTLDGRITALYNRCVSGA